MIGNKIEPFKFWCQKVLPNVYDDSLSYYEYLCKLNKYLDDVITQMNTLTEAEEAFQEDLTAQWNDYKTNLTGEWNTYKSELTAEWNAYKTDLTEQWTITKNYIDNYFNNLDVQNEINNKLDQMVLNGTMSNLLNPLVANNIPTYVTSWLNENVDPVGSAIVIDTSLTVGGAAADAKVTGNRLNLGIYTSPTDNQVLGENVDLSGAVIHTDEGVNLNGVSVPMTGYNNIVFNVTADKQYFIRYFEGSDYASIRSVELIKNNAAIAYIVPPSTGYHYVKIHDFVGTVRICYRAVDSSSLQAVYCYSPYEKLSLTNSEKIDVLEANFDYMFYVGKNLYNPDDDYDNHYISWNNGNYYDNEWYKASGFMPMESGEYYTISNTDQTCIYDENMNFIGGFYVATSGGTTTVYSSPELGNQSDWLINYSTTSNPVTILCQNGWKYLRQSIDKARFSNIYMFEKSQTLTSYEPYMLNKEHLAIDSKLIKNIGAIDSNRSCAKIVKDALQIKIIGDSIVAGYGGTGFDDSSTGGGDYICSYSGGVYSNVSGHCWTNSLCEYWENKFNCTVKNYGVNGFASDNLIQYWNDMVKNEDNIVICMIGTNDRADQSNLNGFINNLEQLYLKSLQSEKELIFISCIPASVSNETNGTKNFHMEDVEHAIRYVTDVHNIPFINLYSLFMDYCDMKGITIDSLLSDGLHPNDNGYDVMFKLITNAFGITIKRPNATW